jgi:hypothetical protein
LGLTVVRQNESGKVIDRIEDPRNLLSALIPNEDGSFFCLRFIDWYGDTIFNRLQIKEQFLPEWKRLFRQTLNEDQRTLLQNIEKMAERCLDQPRQYLEFMGD